MKKYIISSALFLVVVSASSIVSAQDWQPTKPVSQNANTEIMKAYQNYSKIPPVKIVVPTIVQADFDASAVFGDNYAVYNETQSQFVPSISVSENRASPYITTILNSANGQVYSNLFDNNPQTKQDFYLNSNGQNTVGFSILFSNPIRTNSFTMSLDKNVSLPDSVTVQAYVNNKWVIVLNKVKPTGSVLVFPETISNDWVVQVSYSQSIRIVDISFSDLTQIIAKKSVRFLAQPNNAYTVYINADRAVSNYASNESTYSLNTNQYKNLGSFAVNINSSFVASDYDNDGVTDIKDNCKTTSNTDQKDEDGNGVGDVCDDYDHDRVINSIDNCPNLPNYDQRDTDGDKIGDKCDPDESRLTEKYPVVIWVGLGFASMILLGLLAYAGIKMRKNVSIVSTDSNNINK